MEDLSQLWIIDKDAGICIFEQNFKPLPKDINPDLISGFFIALINFAQEMSGQEIEYIQLKALRIYFQPMKTFVFAFAATPPHENLDSVYKLMGQIQTRFGTRYQTVIEKGYFGQTSLFDNFATDVEDVVGRKAESFGYLKEKADVIKTYIDNAKSEYNTLKVQILQRVGLPVPEKDLSIPSLIKTQYNAAKGVAKEKITEIKHSASQKITEIKLFKIFKTTEKGTKTETSEKTEKTEK